MPRALPQALGGRRIRVSPGARARAQGRARAAQAGPHLAGAGGGVPPVPVRARQRIGRRRRARATLTTVQNDWRAPRALEPRIVGASGVARRGRARRALSRALPVHERGRRRPIATCGSESRASASRQLERALARGRAGRPSSARASDPDLSAARSGAAETPDAERPGDPGAAWIVHWTPTGKIP